MTRSLDARVAWVVLFAFATGFLSASASEMLADRCEPAPPAHVEGTSCPDSDDQGHGCDPACPCACCPGHVPAAAFPVPVLGLGVVLPSESLAWSRQSLQPQDVHSRIFHPPRT